MMGKFFFDFHQGSNNSYFQFYECLSSECVVVSYFGFSVEP